MQHLQKTGGGGVLWLTSILLALTIGRSDVRTCQCFNALFIRSFRSLLKECFTALLHSQGSTLFLKTAGVYPALPILELTVQRQQSRITSFLFPFGQLSTVNSRLSSL